MADVERMRDEEIAILREKHGNALIEIDRAYQALELCGVPRERAKSVANGIQVFMARTDKERHAYQATTMAARADVAALKHDLAALAKADTEHLTDLEAARADARSASAIAMAFMFSHLGAVPTFSAYQREKWDELAAIAKRCAP